MGALDWLDQTPLHVAAMGGRDSLVRCLLAAGADPGAQDESGCTPLHRCAHLRWRRTRARKLGGCGCCAET